MCRAVREGSTLRPVKGDVIDGLADRVAALAAQTDRVLVGIDGPAAAGKTTLADRLADRLHLTVVRASVDGFHRPRAVRRRRGELSADGYYRDAYDVEALVGRLLRPFAAGAARVATQVFDHAVDEVAEALCDVPPHAALVVDGVFVQRDPLRGFWTLSVYLDVPPGETLRRALVRDEGDPADIEQRYRDRYLPAQGLYRAEVDPVARAHVVLDNTDPAAPVALRW